MAKKTELKLAYLLPSVLLASCGLALDLQIAPPIISPYDSKTVTFTADGDDAEIVTTWAWYFGDSSLPAASRTVVHTFDTTGTYKIRMGGKRGFRGGGHQIDLTICAGELEFSALSQTCSTATIIAPELQAQAYYAINWGDLPSWIEYDDLTHFYADQGRYEIRIKWAGGQCNDTVYQSRYIWIGDRSTAAFAYSKLGTLLAFESTSAGSNASFSWDFGDGWTSDQEDIEHFYNSPGEYKVRLVAGGNDCVAADTFRDTILVPPPAEHFLTPFKDKCECNNVFSTIQAPTYEDSESRVVLADGLPIYRPPYTETIDNMSSFPTLKWDATTSPYSYQVAIITKEKPYFLGGTLQGVTTHDWMWTSAMHRGGNGQVEYKEGRRISNIASMTNIQFESQEPSPLQPGGIYFWMVYAFDDNGSAIVACSRIHVFQVVP